MRIFVTGAAGFIGSALVPNLIQAGHHVLGLTRSDAGAEALRAAGADVKHGNIEDLDSLRDWSRTSHRRRFLAEPPQRKIFLQAGTWPYAATAQELECGDRARVSCRHGPKPLRSDEKVGLIC